MQSNSLARPSPSINPSIISSRVVSALAVVFVEIMFFSGLLSSFFVIKRGREIWDAAGSIHLPVMATGFNTLILFASGVTLFLVGNALKRQKNTQLASTYLFRTIAISCFFLAFQIYQSAQLINSGLTISSSVFGGCYYLMIGSHLLQVFLGILLMIQFYAKIKTAKPESSSVRDYFNGLQIFWLFVIGMWPVLYAEIYF